MTSETISQDSGTQPRLFHSTPAAMYHTVTDPGISTIRQPHRPLAASAADEDQNVADVETTTWATQKVTHLSPIEEESSLCRTSSSTSSSSRSAMCSTITASHPGVIEEEPMDEQVVIPSDNCVGTAAPAEMDCSDDVVDGVFTGDPFSSSQRALWMSRVVSNLSQCPGYSNLSQKLMPEVSQKFLGKAVILDEDDQTSVFVLKEVLGVGAFATVFSANHVTDSYDENKENIVALKVSSWRRILCTVFSEDQSHLVEHVECEHGMTPKILVA